MKCISTLYNRLFWLLAFLLCFCFSNSVHADTCPAGYPSTTGVDYSYIVAGQTAYKYPTPEIACSSAAAVDKFWGNGYTGSGSGTGGTACTVTNTATEATFTTSIGTSPGCPPGYALNSEGVCACDGACPEAGTSAGGGGSWSGSSSTGCNGSCELSSGGSCISSNDPITGLVLSTWCSSLTFTGNSCSGDDDVSISQTPTDPTNTNPTKPSDCPPQTGYAEINGSGLCLPSGSNYSGGSSTSTDSVTGNTTTVNTTTTINSDGSRTTTTVTNVYDSGGGLLSSNTTSETGTEVGDGKGKQDIDLGTAPNIDQTLPGESDFNIRTMDNPVFSTSIFTVDASCPAPIDFEAMGQEFSISFDAICDLAYIIRAIILILASVVSIRLLVTS